MSDEESDEDLNYFDPKIQGDPVRKMLWLAEHGWTKTANELLATDSSLVRCCDADKYTPLHRAAYNGHTETIQMLLDNGADILARTIDGWQPLHCAAMWNEPQAVSLLLRSGAKINATTNGGQSALHLASTNKLPQTVLNILLSDTDVDVALTNRAGDTARDVCKRSSDAYGLFDKT